MPLENIVGKGENAGNQHFLLFSPCFLPFPNFNFSVTIILSSANVFNLDRSKILSFDKELIGSRLKVTLPHTNSGSVYVYITVYLSVHHS